MNFGNNIRYAPFIETLTSDQWRQKSGIMNFHLNVGHINRIAFLFGFLIISNCKIFGNIDVSGSTGAVFTVPDAPTNLVATPGNSQIAIDFTPGADGGNPITNYEYSPDGTNWTPFNPAVTGTSVTITGLTNGTPYTFRLRAVNGDGAGASSNQITATPCVPPVVTCPADLTISSDQLPLDLFTILPGYINTLDCSGAVLTGTLPAGSEANNVTVQIDYTGGNGGFHNGQTVSSTGVNGLTATLTAGAFANGGGTVTYNITGTPSQEGIATFALNIGSQSCNVTVTVSEAVPTYPAGTVFCGSTPTAIVEVTSTTGRIWMDRNLGASQVATSSTDAASYGDLYQWGRRADGHQCRTSTVTSTLSNSDVPPHGLFITAPNTPFNWRSPKNDNLWQGVNGVNNPCPTGYRLPTQTETLAEITSWNPQNAAGAFASPLKWPMAGYRDFDGVIKQVGTIGDIWTSTIGGTSNNFAFYMQFGATYTGHTATLRARGATVRCIKNVLPPPVIINDNRHRDGSRGSSMMPAGGAFSGDGVTGNTFDNEPGQYTITYTYTDENNCSSSCTFNITVISTPSAPTNLVATTPCGNQIEINFTAGADGGSPITNYEYTLDGGMTWIPFSPAVTGTAVTVTDLTCGATYSIQLRAVNAVGTSVSSTTVTATIDNTVTVTYTGATIVNPTNKSASITLSASVTLPVGADASQSQFRFINRDTGQPISGWLTITAGSPSNTGTVTNPSLITLTLGTYEIFRKYKIGFEIGNIGCYTRNNQADDVFITLAEPSCGCY